MPIVLNQRRFNLTYLDVEGERYHYPRSYWGRVASGDRFLYYEPEERSPNGLVVGRAYFGAGVIGSITPDQQRPDHRYAELLDYEQFTAPVSFRDPSGDYWEVRSGNKIVWQNSVRALDTVIFDAVVAAGGILAPIETLNFNDPLTTLAAIDAELANATPQAHLRYVRQVERPSVVSSSVKRLENFVCQWCGVEGFLQRNGTPYAEAHHLVPVSELAAGSLASSYVVCLCATCHRRMHYAPVKLSKVDRGWTVDLNGEMTVMRTLRG